MLRLWLIAIGALALPASAPAQAQTSPAISAATDTRSMIEKVDRALADAAREGFGGAVIIRQGDTVLLAKGYGYADRESRIVFTPQTVAQIGSITKSQTAVAIATLIAEGKVALSDPVAKFIPDAPEPGRSRTIAQLLSHRSGLIDGCTDDFAEQSEAMLVRTCLARPLAAAVGENHYSNLGYSVLALIIERVTGKSWEDAVRERVWEPLGMRDIGFTFRGQDDEPYAHGYLKGQKQPVISRSIARLNGHDWALRGNGGLQASASTMMGFLDALLDPQSALSPAARGLVSAPLAGQSGDVQEGFGLFFRYEDGKLLRMGHSGSDGVFFSYLAWLPRNDVRFYFVGNNGEDEARAVLRDVLRAAMDLPPRSR